MPFYRLIALMLATLSVAACSEAPPTAGEPKDFAAVCDKANNGKRVSVDGYLRLPDSFTVDGSMVLRLYKAGDFKGTPTGVQTNIGSQANQVEKVPKLFSDSDLKGHLSDGQVALFGTKVRVSGKVYFPLVGQEFPCALENPLVESAS